MHDQKMKILKIQEEEAAFRRDIASAELNLIKQRSMLDFLNVLDFKVWQTNFEFLTFVS